jgi:hypothetical protein
MPPERPSVRLAARFEPLEDGQKLFARLAVVLGCVIFRL